MFSDLARCHEVMIVLGIESFRIDLGKQVTGDKPRMRFRVLSSEFPDEVIGIYTDFRVVHA